MATASSTEARELSLLDKVELRFALADSDVKLQTALQTYLTPVLLKLASEHVNVRNKVGRCSRNQKTCPISFQGKTLC